MLLNRLFLLVAAFGLSASAADDDVSVESESAAAAAAEVDAEAPLIEEGLFGGDLVARHRHLRHEYTFLESSNATEFTAGEYTTFLFALINNDPKETFTINYIDASFRFPGSWSDVLLNFSNLAVKTPIQSNEQLTLQLPLTSHPSFINQPIGLAIFANYHDSDMKAYRHPLFNGTIAFNESSNHADMKNAVLLAFAVVVMAAFAIGIKVTVAPPQKARRAKVEKERGTLMQAESDWLAGTNAAAGETKRVKGMK